MNILVYVLLAAVMVGALGFAFVPALMGTSRADKRMKALQGDIQANRRTADAARARDVRRRQIQDTIKQQTDALGRTRRRVPLQDQIYQAGMKVKAASWIRNQIIVGVVVFALCYVLQLPAIELANIPLPLFHLIFGAAGAYLLPRVFMNFRRGRYQA